MQVSLLLAGDPGWNSEVERVGLAFGAPDNAVLYPYHFLTVTLPRLGGGLALVEQAGKRIGVGFLFPRGLDRRAEPPRRTYTLRYHRLPHADQPPAAEISGAVSEAMGGLPVTFYDPLAPQAYIPTHADVAGADVGRPSAAEAAAVRRLQQTIWGSPDEFLYPTDIHTPAFRMGTSLVARVEGSIAGFLFGMYRFGGPELPAVWGNRFNTDLRLESQVMGVLPEHRGLRLGFLLKKVQAQQAWQEGIGVVHWTVDPLQYPNAALNFGLLRAVAINFYPDLYPFRNELNRVHASRFSLTWLVGTRLVRDVPLTGGRALVLDLGVHKEVVKVNRGWEEVEQEVDSPLIAVETPADWTAMQRDALDEAVRWRESTDRIFSRYVGSAAGQYAITGVGVHDERRYLIGERADEALWARLGRTEE